MSRSRSILAAVFLLVSLSIRPASADTIKAYVPFEGHHWVAFKIFAEQGNAFKAAIWAQSGAEEWAQGAYLIYPDRTLFGATFVMGSQRMHVETAVTGPLVKSEPSATNDGFWQVTLSEVAPQTGEYTVLLISANKHGVDGSAWVVGDAGVQVLGHTSGNRTFAYGWKDFAGTANVRANASIAMGGNVRESIGSSLWGGFDVLSSVPCEFSYDTPNGHRKGGAFFAGPTVGGVPGDYAFHIDRCVGNADVILWGADVTLP